MNITVEFPEREINRFVGVVFDRQVPFATTLALNRTGIDFQKKQREHLRSVFEIRRKQFADRSIKIKPFATKLRPEVRISVDSPAGRSDIFGKFEDQTRKSPFRGRSVAVPTQHVPRTPAGIIRKGWRPSQLLGGAGTSTQHGRGRVIGTRGDVFTGARRTFLIRRPGGRGTIFQRTPDGVRALYQLVPSVGIEPELQFVRNASRTVDDRWRANFLDAFDRAIRTAR
jgi:hypothetical protein